MPKIIMSEQLQEVGIFLGGGVALPPPPDNIDFLDDEGLMYGTSILNEDSELWSDQ